MRKNTPEDVISIIEEGRRQLREGMIQLTATLAHKNQEEAANDCQALTERQEALLAYVLDTLKSA
jgi:hypothetical protein